MFNLHGQLASFYNGHVRLNGEDRKKLAGYRETNLSRLDTGLDKLGEEEGKVYAYPLRVCNQGSYAMHTLNQLRDNDYDIDIALIFCGTDLPNTALDARKRVENALRKGGGNFAK